MSCGSSDPDFDCMFAFTEEAEGASETAKWPLIGVTSHGLTSCEVYEISVTVTNCSGGKLNIGEGGEDVDWSHDLWWWLVTK